METNPSWIRLHPDATDATLATSVQARLHDPLWLLGRQWQFGELRHDAGATPVDVRLEGTSSPLTRLRGGPVAAPGAGSAVKVINAPLEALVEREAVSERGIDNLRLRTEAGMHLVRLLRAGGLADRVVFWVAQSPFVIPEHGLDAAARNWAEMVQGRVPDGATLPTAIRARLAAGAEPPIAADEATIVRAWLAWARGRFERPAAGASTWDAEHVEYHFGVAGLDAAGEAVLAAPEYSEGRLEWYDFEHAAGSLGATGQATARRSFRIPAPLDFAGMPNPRFWTFEDPGMRFDALELLSDPLRPPSPATMLVLDFALSYSDDWFLVPITLDAWTLFDPVAVAITDVFGDTTLAQPPAGRWNMFRLDSGAPGQALSRLFLAAAPIEANQGPSIEEVHLLRDEVANAAWAIERVVPHPLGHGMELRTPVVQTDAAAITGLTWTLTPPPPLGNWMPLLPTVIGRLALGVTWNARNQRPAGRMLAPLVGALRLHQEEVPPEGAQVVRQWQSARGIDGSLHFWIGRRKTPRLSDIAPAVRFDVVNWK